MFQHLLVPLDGSHLAEVAIPAALEIARRFDSQITLVRVVRPPQITLATTEGAVFTELLNDLRQQEIQEATTYLKSMQGSLRQQGYVVHTHLIEGEPIADLILEVAEGLDVDGIVMSTHGRSGLSRWVFGSVAEKVLRGAAVPVVLIRAKEDITHLDAPAKQHIFQN